MPAQKNDSTTASQGSLGYCCFCSIFVLKRNKCALCFTKHNQTGAGGIPAFGLEPRPGELQRSRIVPFPFCQITLKAEKPLKDRYTKSLYRLQLKNIGADLKRKRLQSGLSQVELAEQVGIRVETVQNWEHGRSIPAICYLPRIIEFLGYDPMESWKKAD
jgi:DNA-binding XRE family transcriptional regulator